MSMTPTTSLAQTTTTTTTATTSLSNFTSVVSGRHRSLMEMLLAKKMETTRGSVLPDRPLIRTDSLDSTSSVGSVSSMAFGEDFCRCDDCLLGIADLYTTGSESEVGVTKKKVTIYLNFSLLGKGMHLFYSIKAIAQISIRVVTRENLLTSYFVVAGCLSTCSVLILVK